MRFRLCQARTPMVQCEQSSWRRLPWRYCRLCPLAKQRAMLQSSSLNSVWRCQASVRTHLSGAEVLQWNVRRPCRPSITTAQTFRPNSCWTRCRTSAPDILIATTPQWTLVMIFFGFANMMAGAQGIAVVKAANEKMASRMKELVFYKDLEETCEALRGKSSLDISDAEWFSKARAQLNDLEKRAPKTNKDLILQLKFNL